MAFKFPSFFFPMGGGARKVDADADADTVIVDDLSPNTGLDTRSAPPRLRHARAQKPERRVFELPLLGKLPLRKQLAVLFPILASSLLLAFMFMWLDANQSASIGTQTRLVGDSLMHSQRLAKAAPVAVRGQGEAFRQLADSRSKLAEALNVLMAGGTIRERNVDAVAPELQQAVQKLAELWKRTEQASAALLQQQPDRADTAILSGSASVRINGVADAVQVEGGQFRRLNHIADRDVLRRARQRIPTTRAACAVDDAGATHAQKNLLDVIGGQSLASRDVPSSDRPSARATRKMQGTNESVFRPRRNAHPSSLWLPGRADKFCAGKARGRSTAGDGPVPAGRDPNFGHFPEVKDRVDIVGGQ